MRSLSPLNPMLLKFPTVPRFCQNWGPRATVSASLVSFSHPKLPVNRKHPSLPLPPVCSRLYFTTI